MYSNTYMRKGGAMDTITYTAARVRLADTMDQVCDDHQPLIITRNGQQSVAMMSLDAISSLDGGRGKELRLAE